MKLEDLKPARGSKKKPKRVGRGPGSGHGKTSTKGHKGQKARSGGAKPSKFEGGQMPFIRRVPKRGFSNFTRKEFAIINLGDLNRFQEKTEITPELLREKGLIKKTAQGIKVLGDGELLKPLVIKAHKFSQGALEKITTAGGKAEVI